MSNWINQLKQEARLKGMCADERAYLGAVTTKKEALRLYYKTIDWALECQYPTMELLRNEFTGMESEGIYIDHTFNGELLDEHQCYVFHNCKGQIRVGLNLTKAIIPMLYFANGCDMQVEVVTNCRVPLYIFGKNKVLASENTVRYQNALK